MATKETKSERRKRLRQEMKTLVAEREEREVRTCDVCGRGLPKRKGKVGRTRERHTECSTFESRKLELMKLLDQKITFTKETDGFISEMRASLIADLVNTLTPTRVRRSDEVRDFMKRGEKL